MCKLKNLFIIVIFNYLLNDCTSMEKDKAMTYLKEFGYTKDKNSENMTQLETKNAIEQFQKFNSIPVTGELNEETLAQMDQPRCGKPDGLPIINNEKRWNKNFLTYAFKNHPNNKHIIKKKAEEEILKAFNRWTKVIPIVFQEKTDDEPVDIEIRFLKRAEGDGFGGTLAYAFFPSNGDIYFDDEPWTHESPVGSDFQIVAAHEIGHSLGLGHSELKNALMYPYILPYTSKWTLHKDDITKINELYGYSSGNYDAMFLSKDYFLYVIKNDYCWKIKYGKIEDGFPKLVTQEWKNCPKYIRAAFAYEDDVYFFTDDNLWKYDGETTTEISFSKKQIHLIDAAVVVEDRLYIFKDDQYVKYQYNNGKWVEKKGFPKLISSFWTGVPSNIDAVYCDNDIYLYFTKFNQVYKFNINKKQVDSIISTQDFFK